MAEEIPLMVKQAAESVAGTGNVSVDLVWDPPWTLDKRSDTARLELDLTAEGW
jgi:metal-sulfur cluster biosynthetic enzyme